MTIILGRAIPLVNGTRHFPEMPVVQKISLPQKLIQVRIPKIQPICRHSIAGTSYPLGFSLEEILQEIIQKSPAPRYEQSLATVR